MLNKAIGKWFGQYLKGLWIGRSNVLVLHEHKAKQEAQHIMQGSTLLDSDLVFSNLKGLPLRPNTVTRAWSMLASRAGVKHIRLHDARHTHASFMLKQGTNPKVVQERLGHSSIQITLDIYSHVAPGLQQAAADAFDKMVSSEREKQGIQND